MKANGIRINGLVAGIVVLVLGALMVAESVTSVVAGSPFMFREGVNRGFEFMVGFVAIVLAASTIDQSRKQH